MLNAYIYLSKIQIAFILPDEKYYKVGRTKNFDQRIKPYKKCGNPSTKNGISRLGVMC